MRTPIQISILLFALICLGACSSRPPDGAGGKPGDKVAPISSGKTVPGSVAAIPSSGILHLTVQAYKYVPNAFQAKAGQHVQLTLINRDTMPHSLSIDLGSGRSELKRPVGPGKAGALAFTAPTKPGSYSFFCPIQNHRERGMTGKMIVVAR